MIISKTSIRIISKSNPAANTSKIQFCNFRILKRFRSTAVPPLGRKYISLCRPWAGSRAPEYAAQTSRLLKDPSLAHRLTMSSSRKRRGSAALPSYMRYARPRHNPADQGSLLIRLGIDFDLIFSQTLYFIQHVGGVHLRFLSMYTCVSRVEMFKRSSSLL